MADAALTIEPGERLLVTGPSGSGKSTLFRALAGIWPYGRGRIRIPQGARVLFLPQKPYIPIAPLRDAVAYPGQPGEFPDDAVRRVLGEVGLEALAARIDEHDNWSMRLSGGEQQRLADALAQRLIGKDYKAYVVPPASRAPPLFPVRVGKFREQREADQCVAKLKKEEQFEPWIVR